MTVRGAPGCTKQIPPAPTPERLEPPAHDAHPRDEGDGRLVVDVVQKPTSVYRVRMEPEPSEDGEGRVLFEERREILCETSPCVVDLRPGNVLLGFPRLGDGEVDVDLVHVSPRTTVYRRSLSQFERNQGSIFMSGLLSATLGGTSATVGAALLPLGLATDSRGYTTAGTITLTAGAVGLAYGIWAIRRDSPRYRPGSSIHFPASDEATRGL